MDSITSQIFTAVAAGLILVLFGLTARFCSRAWKKYLERQKLASDYSLEASNTIVNIQRYLQPGAAHHLFDDEDTIIDEAQILCLRMVWHAQEKLISIMLYDSMPRFSYRQKQLIENVGYALSILGIAIGYQGAPVFHGGREHLIPFAPNANDRIAKQHVIKALNQFQDVMNEETYSSRERASISSRLALRYSIFAELLYIPKILPPTMDGRPFQEIFSEDVIALWKNTDERKRRWIFTKDDWQQTYGSFKS